MLKIILDQIWIMRLLIGIDDTDNKESRGTGYNSRQLASAIEANGLGRVHGITRHQLFIHPDIPYTSQNSSACLDVDTESYKYVLYWRRTGIHILECHSFR